MSDIVAGPSASKEDEASTRLALAHEIAEATREYLAAQHVDPSATWPEIHNALAAAPPKRAHLVSLLARYFPEAQDEEK